MSTFTIKLKDVLEYTDQDIGLDTYPIFDENYRQALNDKIIDHYWNREIGQETIGMFQLAMRRKMNEIMPYYNQLYESELIKFDPISTFKNDSTSEQDGTNQSESQGTNSSTSTGKSRTVASETPQTRLAGDEDYASSAQDSASESTADGQAGETNTGSTNTTSTAHSEGYNGSPSDLLARYRATFLNVDLMVLNELEELFMLVWDNGDSYTPGSPFIPGYWYGSSYGWY